MKPVKPLYRLLVLAGGIAMLIGAIDPMEGAFLILPGSGLFALGTYLSHAGKELTRVRALAFVLIAIGVSALIGLSMAGGFGGGSGLSAWWGLLIAPYPIGWSISIWGPYAPRWLLWPGIGIGTWYLFILVSAFVKAGLPAGDNHAVIYLGAFGALTIGGCIYRLLERHPVHGD